MFIYDRVIGTSCTLTGTYSRIIIIIVKKIGKIEVRFVFKSLCQYKVINRICTTHRVTIVINLSLNGNYSCLNMLYYKFEYIFIEKYFTLSRYI